MNRLNQEPRMDYCAKLQVRMKGSICFTSSSNHQIYIKKKLDNEGSVNIIFQSVMDEGVPPDWF